MAQLRKVSLALDPALVSDLDYVSGRLGISRSALVGQLLGEAVSPMREIFEQIPLSPTPADVVRFRGESAKVVEARLAELQGIAHDLFAD